MKQPLIKIPFHKLVKISLIIAFFIALIGSSIFIGTMIPNEQCNSKNYSNDTIHQCQIDTLLELNEANIHYWLNFYEVKHANIVYSQIILETGYFTSGLAINNNNLFGMKYPRQRETMSKNEYNGYAYYETWIYSIKDYSIWQKKYYKDSTEDYYKFLNKRYAEDSTYINKLKQLTKN